jgi:hypothetical protein
MNADSVVLLPEPVGPVTKISPSETLMRSESLFCQIQFTNRLNVGWNQTEARRDPVPLHENIDAKAADAR